MSTLLQVQHLAVRLPVGGELRTVLRDVSFGIGEGEALGLVGESGSGKSMTARAVARLLPEGAEQQGSIHFAGADIATLKGAALRDYRAAVAMVFQDPRAHVNPVRTIGDFMTEALRTNHGVSRAEAAARAVARLAEVGIPDGVRRMEQHPHELSGGLLQRVMIASALLTEPRLLLADEPTTALDVTTQAEVMAILDDLRRERGVALLFITHDLELAAAVCDRIAVMYAGSLMQEQPSATLDTDPLHPYTAALLQARPDIDRVHERLLAIPGRPLSAFEAPAGCPFGSRCGHAEASCADSMPPLVDVGGGRSRCRRLPELRGSLLPEVAPGESGGGHG